MALDSRRERAPILPQMTRPTTAAGVNEHRSLERLRLRLDHHAAAQAFALGHQPTTTTEKILSEDPAFRELVSFYESEASR
jgi:hypothetical protein